MGTQVERVPRGVALEEQPAGHRSSDFGFWFERQRRVRDISLYFVAAQTRLPLERVRAIESGEETLGHDGQSRALARILAEAIGADPEAAAGHLLGPRKRTRTTSGLPLPWIAWAERFGLAIVMALVGWLLASWLLATPTEDVADPVYRSDYVDRLLTDPQSE